MNRDTVVAFNNVNASTAEGHERQSLPPLGDGHPENLNPQRRTVDQDARPNLKWRISKTTFFVSLLVGVLSGLGYLAYTVPPGKRLTDFWPASTSSSPAKPDAITLLTQRVTQIEAAQTLAASRDTALQDDMTAVQHALQDVATTEQFAVLETQLESGHTQLDTRLSKLEHSQRQRIKIAARQAAVPAVFVPTLPFQVLSIDLWNDRPYVAVSVAGVTELLAVGDHRAGWAVLDINRNNGQATFVNNKDGTTLKRSTQDGST